MPLTPADVHNVAFSKPPIGKWGYHEDEVDAFLDLVKAELTRLIEDNCGLRKQLDQQRRAAPADTGPTLRPLEPPRPAMAPIRPSMREQAAPGGDHHVHAAKVLGMAQEIADQMAREAKAEADGMVNKARAASAQLLSEARAKAEAMVNEARTRTETMVNEARSRAEALDRQSREKAASCERDAVRKHTEILDVIGQEKAILEKKIDELRTFEREYRTRLMAYLNSQLRELDGRGSAPADPMRNQQSSVVSGSGAPAEPGAHRCDPKTGTAGGDGADVARFSARNGSPDSETRWKPAVGLGGVAVR